MTDIVERLTEAAAMRDELKERYWHRASSLKRDAAEEITRLRQLLSEAETREREAREFNSAWAEAAAKALDGDMRELRIRVQLSGSEWEATSSELRQTDLVTISELTERFGISPMTLHRWRRDQRVNFPKEIRVGRLVRFSARQIEQWLNDQAASGRAALERSEG